MKKILLTTGIIAAAILPAAAVISCSSKTYQTPEEDKMSIKQFIAKYWFLNSVNENDFKIKTDEETGQITEFVFEKSQNDIFDIIINSGNFGLMKTTKSSFDNKLKLNDKIFGQIDLQNIEWIEFDNPPSPLKKMFMKDFNEEQMNNIQKYNLFYKNGFENGKWEEFFNEQK